MEEARTFYVLYDDGSVREFTPNHPRVQGNGEWAEIAPPDAYAKG